MKYTAIILSLFILYSFVLAQEIKFEEYSHKSFFDPTMRQLTPQLSLILISLVDHGNAILKMWYNDGNGNIYLTESLDEISWGANTLLVF